MQSDHHCPSSIPEADVFHSFMRINPQQGSWDFLKVCAKPPAECLQRDIQLVPLSLCFKSSTIIAILQQQKGLHSDWQPKYRILAEESTP
ncbi:hypothetical protein EYF80_013960 [Liparis tanakae]|uniref:Uncharacterized protein n=1 Tax=Liparis tanakae TaxID=230148 RepID=A0A4Z2IFE5_9TELE|nr:hypothetical protein EYF80_013960 [Liparis tanakae]